MGEEYFNFSRHFMRIDVSSRLLEKSGKSKVPDYINAYFNRPARMYNISLFDFIKNVKS